MFAHLPPYAGDPILALVELFLKDPRPEKVNLSIGVYADDNGRLPVLASVQEAASAVRADALPYNYLPISGDPGYLDRVKELIFGTLPEAHAQVAMIQTIGGSGALKIGAEFLHTNFPNTLVYVSDPTWDNHIGLFESAGFQPQRYPYYDHASNALDFDGMCQAFENMPEGSIVLLHPCCHNPTGIDPDREQWEILLGLIERRTLLPFFDMAYQGFADSFDEDIWPVHEAARRGMNFMLSHSFSKIFSLYSERCGTLSIFCSNKSQVPNALGQLKRGVRRNYSSPPAYGAALIRKVLESETLTASWKSEVAAMRARIRRMREALHGELLRRDPSGNFDFLLNQRGMFSYTGLDPLQVARLKDAHAVYALASGRICVAGLNAGNLSRVADALVAVRSTR